MTRRATISVEVELADGADADELGEALFSFLASDPDDLFPAIETVDDVDVELEVEP